MKRKKKITNFAELADRVVCRADKNDRRKNTRVVIAWREIAGDEINKHTHSSALRSSGELIVYVDSVSWANQLTLMSSELLDRLTAHLDENLITSLRFIVSRTVKQESQWETNNETTTAFYVPNKGVEIPLNEAEFRQVEEITQVISDQELRKVALRVMVKDLEQKKGVRLQQPDG